MVSTLSISDRYTKIVSIVSYVLGARVSIPSAVSILSKTGTYLGVIISIAVIVSILHTTDSLKNCESVAFA